MKKFIGKLVLAILSIAIWAPALGAVGAVAMTAGTHFAAKSMIKYANSKGYAFDLMTVADLTFTGEEVKELSECVLEEAFKTPGLGDFHTIETGIITTKQIAILGRLGLVGKSGKGCDPSSDSNNIPRSEKYWAPASVSTRLEACYKDASLLDSFFLYGQNKGISRADLTKTDFFNFVKELLVVELKEAAFRIAWFGKTDHATVSDSPAGVLTAGTDVDFFNHIKGLWQQIYEIVAGDSTKRVTIARNAQATFANQKFDSADTTNMVVSGYLETALYDSDYRLRDKTDLVYITTQSIADQYAKELKHANQAYTTERLENGITILKSDGIEVIGFNLWDRMIRTYFSDGTKWYQPHRFVLTTKTNLRIGLEDEAALKDIAVHFDQVTKKNYIDSEFMMDAKLIENHLFMAGY